MYFYIFFIPYYKKVNIAATEKKGCCDSDNNGRGECYSDGEEGSCGSEFYNDREEETLRWRTEAENQMRNGRKNRMSLFLKVRCFLPNSGGMRIKGKLDVFPLNFLSLQFHPPRDTRENIPSLSFIFTSKEIR